MTFVKAFRATAVSVIAAAALSVGAGTVMASAPQLKSQSPGFYRVMIGDFEVTALCDGTLPMEVDKLLTNIKPAQLNSALARSYLKALVEASVNAFLVNTGDKLVLIDTGAGALFGPKLGKLQTSIAAAGYKPEQVDEIYVTHLHADHIGGLMVGDKIAFPNAIVRADQHDADFWLAPENLSKAPAEMKDFFKGAQASLNPYIKAGKFKPFDGDTELVPGVKALAARGHTPGHSFIVAESKGQKIMFWGDVLHVASVQFANPAVTIKYDVDSKAAAAQRKKAFADAARQGYFVAAAHVSFPGIGQVRAEGKGYVWLPVNYSAMQ